MSYKWTNFVKGPTLQSEPIEPEETPEQESTAESEQGGEEESEKEEDTLDVHQFYTELINQPSTSATLPSLDLEDEETPSSSNSKPAVKPSFETNLKELLLCVELDDADTLLLLTEASNFESLINATDDFGWTPLMVAACAGATDSVDLLLKVGADFRVVDKKGLSALDFARIKSRKDVITLLQNWAERCKTEDGGDSSSEDKDPEPGYCEACKVNYRDETEHSKSIAHLVTTSEGSTERTHYGIPESNRGFQLLLKTGWDRESGLGPEGKGQKFPVKTVLRTNRAGIGSKVSTSQAKAKVTHFGPHDLRAVKDRVEKQSTVDRRHQDRQRRREARKEIALRRELKDL